jgi:hypothetical protein
MKVYILLEYDAESYAEILGVFDTLEKAQSYKGDTKKWSTDHLNTRWWDSLGKIHCSIGEWEVK